MFGGSLLGRVSKAMSKVKEIISQGGHARVLDPEIDEEPKDDEIFYDDVAIEIPDDLDKDTVSITDDLTDNQLAMSVVHSIQRPEEQMKKSEPDDKVFGDDEDDQVYDTMPEIPDDYRVAYYPAGGETGGKPDMSKIRTWVENVKFATMSDLDKQVEYGIKFNTKTPITWDKKKEKSLINAVAFLVARKLWYVGRKPSGMPDEDWAKLTADKRPQQGSFSKNEHWAGAFPYTEEYSYSTWEDKDIDMLKKSGSVNW